MHACELKHQWYCKLACLCTEMNATFTFPVPGPPRNLQSVIQAAQCNSELRNVTVTWEVSVLPYTPLPPPTHIRHTHNTCMHSYIFTFMIRMLTLLSHFWSEMHVLNLYIYYEVRDCEGYEVSPGPGTVWMKPMAVFSHFRHQSLGHHSSQ